MGSIESIYQRYADTFASKDPGAIVGLHAADGTFWLHAGAGPVQGRDAIARAFGDVFARWLGFGFEVRRVIFADQHWVLDWAMTAHLPGSDGSVRTIRFDALDVVDVDMQGLVSRKDTFVDSVQMRAALGG